VKIVYLVNRYPKASHSFIRREIAALEQLGVDVLRVSIRAPGDDLVDERDLREAQRTRVLLRGPGLGLLAGLLWALSTHPRGFARALGRAWTLGRRSDRGRLVHGVYLAEACALARLARQEGRRHVHAHFGTNPPVVALLAAELAGLEFSFTVHGPEEFDRPGGLKLAEKVAAARFVAAVSEFTRSQVYRWSGHGDWPKVQVVHCGVDELFLEGEPVPVPAAPRLVCVGRLCEQKGQLLLVEAAARLVAAGRPLELVLAGDGEMRAEIERACERLGLGATVRITGWVSNQDVRAEILAARALVLPSFAEGLPVVLMEALALGRPVVSTYVAGIPELVVPGESGWLVPAGDVQALAQAMGAVLEAPREELERMGRAGAERVRANHDARREAGKLRELLGRAA